jgi:hypothetical protein
MLSKHKIVLSNSSVDLEITGGHIFFILAAFNGCSLREWNAK